MRLPTRLDRYPGKMVSRLADRLVLDYALGAESLLDPFSGSGAILFAGQQRGLEVSGIDVNPIAGLFAHVKLRGFSPELAQRLLSRVVELARKGASPLSISWNRKDYWFTPRTLEKFERLRRACQELSMTETDEGMAILLSLVLSVRLCSRADQRSPKPFISKEARQSRSGKHFDPYLTMLQMMNDLTALYGSPVRHPKARFFCADVVGDPSISDKLGRHSHIITSPPYINAQDYFRNFKLSSSM